MKRTLAILLGLLMILALAACKTPTPAVPGNQGNEPSGNVPGGNEPSGNEPSGNEPVVPPVDDALAGTYEVTVWVGEAAVDLTKTQIENFNKENEFGIKIVATVNPVSEADSASQMLVDVSAGADIFCFAQDQFARLVQGGALIQLDDEAAKLVKEANEEGAVTAATTGDKMYAYPLTSDNGYFLYYDKTVIPDADVDSLEKIIEDCEKAGKNFAFECGNAWYLAGWFFGTGCKSDWTTDSDGQFISVADTFNSDKGLIAVKGLKKLVDSPCYLSSSSADIFANNGAAVVTGIWNYEIIKGVLGNNMGVADLPSFEVDGKEYHIGSYNGYKLMGVKPQADADRQIVLQILVEYLTDEARQMERFNELSWGPTNLNAQKNDAVKNHPGLAALWEQKVYAKMQGQIHGSWWDIAKVITDDVKAANDEAGLKAALENYFAKINALFTMTEEEKEAWGVVGAFLDSNWVNDYPMHEVEPGIFESDPLELKAGDEFKIRQGGSWDVNYGMKDGVTVAGGMDTNVIVPADDTYIVRWDSNTLTLSFANLEGVLPEAAPAPEPVEGEEPAAEEPDTWAVIGAIGETNWDTDFPMFFNSENNHWYAVVVLKDGAEFKLRANGDWKLNYGLDENGIIAKDGQTNFKAESGDGAYSIDFKLGEDEGVEISYGKSTWSVIGSFEGSGWNEDVVMTEKEPAVYVSDPIAFKAGDLFKVRADGDWGLNFGITDGVMVMKGKDVKVEADGNYIVTLDLNAGTLTFVLAE